MENAELHHNHSPKNGIVNQGTGSENIKLLPSSLKAGIAMPSLIDRYTIYTLLDKPWTELGSFISKLNSLW